MPTRPCPNCGEWIDKSLLFCPLCRTPTVSIAPTHHRPTAVIAFGIVLAVVVTIAVLLIRRLVQ